VGRLFRLRPQRRLLQLQLLDLPLELFDLLVGLLKLLVHLPVEAADGSFGVADGDGNENIRLDLHGRGRRRLGWRQVGIEGSVDACVPNLGGINARLQRREQQGQWGPVKGGSASPGYKLDHLIS